MRKLLLAVMALTAGVFAQAPPRPGAQVITYHSDIDNSEQPYALYVPASFDGSKPYPLVISLHSEDSNHRLNLRQVLSAPMRFGETDPEDMRNFPAVRGVDYVIACPLARGPMGYQGIGERDVYDVLADVERRLRIDPDRVYLTGISLGGAGALWLGLTRPDVWAGVAPLSPSALPEAEELSVNAVNLPIRLFHGDQDPIVPVETSRGWQRRFLDLGVPATYIEFPGLRHNSWDLAYRGGGVFEWFAQQRRNLYPERVRFVTRSYRYDKAYWVRIDSLTPGTPASIDARRTGAAEVQVQTTNVEGLTIALDKPFALVTIDGTALRMKPAASASFVKAGGKWRAGTVEATGKHVTAEGPAVAAVSERHIYVYGTGGNPSEAELAARRAEAQTAAAWSSARARLSLTLPVKADNAVTDADLEAGSLVLFGTAETNSWIARLTPHLPLSLSRGAADYGLLFIAPAGKHYALVSSGLPWWTGAEDANRGGPAMAPAQFRLLSTFGDFILFKGSLNHVVAEGRFDRNWKVPADASAKLQATGTVIVR